MNRIILTALLACAAVTAQTGKEGGRMKTATGTFEVKMLPPTGAAEDGFLRMSLTKTFHGGLEGTSTVTMMATSDGRSPSGGYVALERFTGKLDGREGAFVMQHSGIMSPNGMELRVLVSPGSGTGALAGIMGKLEIRIEGKQHFYTLDYRLPQ
jgi:hypothetical protein